MGGPGARNPVGEQGEPLYGAPPADLLGLNAVRPAFGAHRSWGVDPVAAVEATVDEEAVTEEARELALVVVIEGDVRIEPNELRITHVYVGPSPSLRVTGHQSVRRTARLEFM
jgi:ApbE superfamily uncharacterized protein (UPF0280 family)